MEHLSGLAERHLAERSPAGGYALLHPWRFAPHCSKRAVLRDSFATTEFSEPG